MSAIGASSLKPKRELLNRMCAPSADQAGCESLPGEGGQPLHVAAIGPEGVDVEVVVRQPLKTMRSPRGDQTGNWS